MSVGEGGVSVGEGGLSVEEGGVCDLAGEWVVSWFGPQRSLYNAPRTSAPKIAFSSEDFSPQLDSICPSRRN